MLSATFRAFSPEILTIPMPPAARPVEIAAIVLIKSPLLSVWLYIFCEQTKNSACRAAFKINKFSELGFDILKAKAPKHAVRISGALKI